MSGVTFLYFLAFSVYAQIAAPSLVRDPNFQKYFENKN